LLKEDSIDFILRYIKTLIFAEIIKGKVFEEKDNIFARN